MRLSVFLIIISFAGLTAATVDLLFTDGFLPDMFFTAIGFLAAISLGYTFHVLQKNQQN